VARRRGKGRGKGVGGILVFAVLLVLIALAIWVWTRPPKQPPDSTGASVAKTAETRPGATHSPATIRIASWNILNLGKHTPVDERAEVIAQFDIVAIQEVESTEGLERLRKRVEQDLAHSATCSTTSKGDSLAVRPKRNVPISLRLRRGRGNCMTPAATPLPG